jgi:hypothetical protein
VHHVHTLVLAALDLDTEVDKREKLLSRSHEKLEKQALARSRHYRTVVRESDLNVDCLEDVMSLIALLCTANTELCESYWPQRQSQPIPDCDVRSGILHRSHSERVHESSSRSYIQAIKPLVSENHVVRTGYWQLLAAVSLQPQYELGELVFPSIRALLVCWGFVLVLDSGVPCTAQSFLVYPWIRRLLVLVGRWAVLLCRCYLLSGLVCRTKPCLSCRRSTC